MHVREYIRHDEKAASRLAPKGNDGGFDFCVAVNSAMIGTTLSDRAAVSNEGIKDDTGNWVSARPTIIAETPSRSEAMRLIVKMA